MNIQPSNKPVDKWPKWYIDTINEHYSELTSEQREKAKKVVLLCKEAVANSVVKDKNTFHDVPLPEGYVYKFDELLKEAIKIYNTIGINQ